MVLVGNVDKGMYMDSGCFIKESTNKSLRSAWRNLTLFGASEIVLFSMICVSNDEAARDAWPFV